MRDKELVVNLDTLTVEEFVNRLSVIKWRVNIEKIKIPKCERCDVDRTLRYTTPRGIKRWEWCECWSAIKKHTPVPCNVMLMDKNRVGVSIGGRAGLTVDKFNIYDGRPYDVGRYWDAVLFNSTADCAVYCEWLNERGK